MVAQQLTSSSSTKDIVITQPDFDRLNNLLDSASYRATHAGSLMILKEELGSGEVVPADEVRQDVVTMRSTVKVRDPRSRMSDTYTLVYPDEADIDKGKLSVLAPLGIALLGARVGQVVTFDAPAGQRRLKVEKILYQPEAAGDSHR
jgi:regulator of nucleoside diphosphate kinase